MKRIDVEAVFLPLSYEVVPMDEIRRIVMVLDNCPEIADHVLFGRVRQLEQANRRVVVGRCGSILHVFRKQTEEYCRVVPSGVVEALKPMISVQSPVENCSSNLQMLAMLCRCTRSMRYVPTPLKKPINGNVPGNTRYGVNYQS